MIKHAMAVLINQFLKNNKGYGQTINLCDINSHQWSGTPEKTKRPCNKDQMQRFMPSKPAMIAKITFQQVRWQMPNVKI